MASSSSPPEDFHADLAAAYVLLEDLGEKEERSDRISAVLRVVALVLLTVAASLVGLVSLEPGLQRAGGVTVGSSIAAAAVTVVTVATSLAFRRREVAARRRASRSLRELLEAARLEQEAAAWLAMGVDRSGEVNERARQVLAQVVVDEEDEEDELHTDNRRQLA